MKPIRVLSTLALASVLAELGVLLPACDLQLASINVLMDLIARRDRGDIAILTDRAVADLVAIGTLDGASRKDLARSHVGLAVL